MEETTEYLGNHPKSRMQCWVNQLWLRLDVTDMPFFKGKKPFRTLSPCLGKIRQSCFYPFRTFCNSVSGWGMGFFFAQRPVLPGRRQAPGGVSLVLNVFSGVERWCQERLCLTTIELWVRLKAIFHISSKRLKIILSILSMISMHLNNLISLNINIINIYDYWFLSI